MVTKEVRKRMLDQLEDLMYFWDDYGMDGYALLEKARELADLQISSMSTPEEDAAYMDEIAANRAAIQGRQ